MADNRHMTVNAHTAGAFTMSDTTMREYMSLTHRSGSNLVLNNTGLSFSSPNNFQTKTDNDSFSTVLNDKSDYVGGDIWNRVEGHQHYLTGDSISFDLNAYGDWSKNFGDIAAANTQPEVSKSTYPAIPGVDPAVIPKSVAQGTNAENPAVKELSNKPILNQASAVQKGVTTITTGIGAVVGAIQKAYAEAQKIYQDLATAPSKFVSAFTAEALKQFNSLFGSKGPPLSPSTQNGNYAANTNREQISQSITATQDKLNQIESVMGSSGSQVHNVARDQRIVIGAAVNDHPQATIDPVGRQVNSQLTVTKEGSNTQVAGAREVQLVDNHGMFPCGNYIIEAGNQIMMSAGGGGVTLHSGVGAVTIMSHTATTIGSANQLVVHAPSTIISGETIEIQGSENVNINCPGQVVFNGSVGIGRNLLVEGGAYINGELFVNHITAPMEVQHTFPGFTSDGARARLVPGQAFKASVYEDMTTVLCTGTIVTSEFGTLTVESAVLQISMIGNSVVAFTDPSMQSSGVATTIGATAYIQPLQTQEQVELYAHAHEFGNIPLTLSQSDGSDSAHSVMRDAASALNAPEPLIAGEIKDGDKLGLKVQTITPTTDQSKSMYWGPANTTTSVA